MLKNILASALCFALTSCIYTDIKVPLDTDLQETDLGTKTGQSGYRSILGLVAWGDAGTQAAAQNGGIKTLKHADKHVLNILGFLYYAETTIVYGN
jgi:hypothetical protein